MEAVTSTSEPVVDVKETVEVEAVEAKVEEQEETTEAEAEDTTEEVEVKEPTKYEKLEAEKAKAIDKMQERINRKTASEKATLEKMSQMQAELEQLKAVAPQADDTPKDTDYDSYDDWQEALIEHRADKMVQEKLLASKQAEFQQAQQVQLAEATKAFETKELAFKEANADYEANSTVFKEQADYLVKSLGDNPILGYLNEAVFSSDVAPAVINELGQDPSLLEDMVTMSPINAVREVFKLEQRLSEQPQQETETPKPKPIKALKGSGKAKSLLTMNEDELLAKFMK